MTVYVDDIRIPARVGRLSARWSHLTVGPDDDISELHAFAAKIGLRRSWFQAKGWPRDHYDVTDSKRQEAIKAGAVPIGWHEAGQMRAEAAERRRAREAGLIAPGDAEPACRGFRWIGQSFASCDGCGKPAWEHEGEMRLRDGAVPFGGDAFELRLWKPGEAAAIRRKWS